MRLLSWFSVTAPLVLAICAPLEAVQQPAAHHLEDLPRLHWTIGATPLLSIGGHPNDSTKQLFEVAGALRLQSGHIVVANSGTQLRFYDSSGELVHQVGREGSGPGEFRRVVNMGAAGSDSIHVFDAALQRLTFVSTTGTLGSSTRIEIASLSGVGRIGRFDNGRWFAREADQVLTGPVGGMRRDTVTYVVFDEPGAEHRLVARVPGLVSSTFRHRGEVGTRTVPFSPGSTEFVSGDCLFILSTDSEEMSVFSSRRELLRVIGTRKRPVRVSDAQHAQWLSATLAPVPESARPVLRQFLSALPVPEHFPRFGSLVVDDLGYIWLEEFRTPADTGVRWFVLRPDGTPIGSLSMPLPLQLLQVGRDHILGYRRDRLGDEYVELFSMNRANEAAQRRTCQ